MATSFEVVSPALFDGIVGADRLHAGFAHVGDNRGRTGADGVTIEEFSGQLRHQSLRL
jgi:hypothetical protein